MKKNNSLIITKRMEQLQQTGMLILETGSEDQSSLQTIEDKLKHSTIHMIPSLFKKDADEFMMLQVWEIRQIIKSSQYPKQKINIDPIKVQKKIVEKKKEDEIEKIVNPPAGPETKIEIPDVVPTDTVNPTTSESIRARNRMLNSNFLQGPTDKITDAKRYRRPSGSTFITRFLQSITPTNTRRGRKR